MNTQETETTSRFPSKLTLYHPTSAGTGAALQIEPKIHHHEPDRANCFFLEMAQQKTAGRRDQGAHATFDWQNKLTVKLGFLDICEILMVLEGRSPSAGGPKGLYHEHEKATTMITLQKKNDQPGFFFGLSRKDKQKGEVVRVHMALSEAEATGLRCLLQTGLFFLTFHAHLFPQATTKAAMKTGA